MSGIYKSEDGEQREILDITSLGAGLKLKTREVMDLTRIKAEWLLGDDPKNGQEQIFEFSGDRPLRQGHVDSLVAAMRRGTFHPEWVNIMLCRFDGRLYRMNGQHTAWARLEMPTHWTCKVELMIYDAMTEEDMRRLYASVDRSSPRTRRNVIESYLKGTPEFESVKAATLKVVPQGFTQWFWPVKHDRQKHDGDDVAYKLKTDHYDLAKKICDFLDGQSPREQGHIFRAAVVGAMFETFQKAPRIAVEFWSPVADGTRLEKRGDPRLKLRNELMQCAVGFGGGSQSTKKKVSQEDMYRICIRAWNAHRSGKVIQVLRPGPSAGKRPRAK